MTVSHSAIAGALFATLLFAGAAFGDAIMVSSIPADKSAGPAPTIISLTFGEKLAPALSSFDLAMPGMKMPALATSLSADGKTLTATPKGGWMKGVYQIHWHAAAEDDDHHTEGTITFTVK